MVKRTKRGGGGGAQPRVREAAPAYVGGAGEEEKLVRKNYWLLQSKIDRAKEILGVTTETEAVDTALDVLIYGEELAAGTEAMAGEEYRDLLGLAAEIPTGRRGGGGS